MSIETIINLSIIIMAVSITIAIYLGKIDFTDTIKYIEGKFLK